MESTVGALKHPIWSKKPTPPPPKSDWGETGINMPPPRCCCCCWSWSRLSPSSGSVTWTDFERLRDGNGDGERDCRDRSVSIDLTWSKPFFDFIIDELELVFRRIWTAGGANCSSSVWALEPVVLSSDVSPRTGDKNRFDFSATNNGEGHIGSCFLAWSEINLKSF